MKLTRLELDGFRCFRERRALKLKGGQSLCLQAENGRGKTSIADALEFWSTGDVAWTHRDGVGLAALVHLDCDEAVVAVQVEGSGVASRGLRGNSSGPLKVGPGPLTVNFAAERLPVLGHRTMAQFVDKSANDKRGELLEALGLDDLGAFRAGIRSVKSQLKRRAKEAGERQDAAERALSAHLGDERIKDALVRLSTNAKLDPKLDKGDALIAWKPPAIQPIEPDSLLSRATELASARDELAQAATDLWAAATEDRAAAEKRGLSALLEAGNLVLEASDEDRCPLCLLEQDRGALIESITERSAELAITDEKFRKAEQELAAHEEAARRLIRATEQILDDDQLIQEDPVGAMKVSSAELRAYLEEIEEARKQRRPLPDPPLPSAQVITAIRKAAFSAPAALGPALVELSTLQGMLSEMGKTKAAATLALSREAAANAAAQLTDEAVERAIETELDYINEPLSTYYTRLVGQPAYTDLHLIYTQARAGGIEFEFKWDGRHEIRPPQRVMSESELNALGLALFLARLKTDPPRWRTMVLDDVVASFDAVHRTRLIRLLAEEFSDWQVILLTHDPQLSRTVIAEAPEWLVEKVTAWSAVNGPTFGPSDMRARLRERLDRGEPAEELGGLARQAIEEALERPVGKMGLKIRHDPANGYSADEYRRALVEGLKEGNFLRADDPVLIRLRTDGSVTNRACHYSEREPGITEQDLRILLEDLDALDRLFHCDDCGKKVWEVPHQGSTRCQCKCGVLSCA